MKVRIDVVIPSFRLEDQFILPILGLPSPAEADIKYYLVADNPALVVSDQLKQLIDNDRVNLLINTTNLGAAASRNKGIDAGNGEWILFLDDDIQVGTDLLNAYVRAIDESPAEIGFIGLTSFPPPPTQFAKAIWSSGSMDIFDIANHKKDFAWGATVNSMVRRSAIGEIRFSGNFPMAGGGEDVDFFLRVRERNDYKNFRTVPTAKVTHPWWNKGEPDFKRPYRYGIGNSWLGQLNPAYTYRDFPNTPEILLLVLIITPLLLLAGFSWQLPFFFIVGVAIIEIIANTVQTIKRRRGSGIEVILYVLGIRFVYETGVLVGKLARGYISGIGQRFHDNGVRRKLNFYRLNTYKTIKWILYTLLMILLLTR